LAQHYRVEQEYTAMPGGSITYEFH